MFHLLVGSAGVLVGLAPLGWSLQLHGYRRRKRPMAILARLALGLGLFIILIGVAIAI